MNNRKCDTKQEQNQKQVGTLDSIFYAALRWMFAHTHYPRELFGSGHVSKKHLYLPAPPKKDRDENDHSISSSSQKQ